MLCTRVLILATLSLLLGSFSVIAESIPSSPIGIVIHGGAGVIEKKNMPPEKEEAYREKLQEALQAGYAVLKKGGASLDAVQAAVVILEDSPLFNAGKGAVYTHEETHELDAAIMNGATLQAGAIAGVRSIKNPVLLARAVMEKSQHVLMIGDGAEAFAKEIGMPQVDNDYFDTEERLQHLRKIKAKDPQSFKLSAGDSLLFNDEKFGTVGAVALDQHGNLAAATSTGGLTNKRFGRVGDVPIIGAGTYADNASCAVSATGHGEFFIRHVVAHSVCALKQYKNLSLEAAAQEVVQKTLVASGGDGGIIAMDREGHIVMEFNTSGMFRGAIDAKGALTVEIYR